MSSFRANLGKDFAIFNVGAIYERFFNKQALVRLHYDMIKVSIYGHPYGHLLKSMYHNLSDKLERKGINCRVPWLNNHKLEFEFN